MNFKKYNLTQEQYDVINADWKSQLTKYGKIPHHPYISMKESFVRSSAIELGVYTEPVIVEEGEE